MSKIRGQIILLIVMTSAFVSLAGCTSKSSTQLNLPPGVTIEEYQLKDAPSLDPLTFIPVNGTQEEILSKHQQERGNSFPDNSFFQDGLPGFSVTVGDEKILALLTFTNYTTDEGVFQKGTVQVTGNGKELYSIQAGDASPLKNLQGLWGYSNHWVLEIAYVDLTIPPQNEISLDVQGQLYQDGELLNDRNDYKEAFNFQMMNGKPFYFFDRDGKIGISYNGQEVILGYSQIPHYQCCSAAQLNPRKAKDMVAFFGQREGKWYYVEIGVFQ